MSLLCFQLPLSIIPRQTSTWYLTLILATLAFPISLGVVDLSCHVSTIFGSKISCRLSRLIWWHMSLVASQLVPLLRTIAVFCMNLERLSVFRRFKALNRHGSLPLSAASRHFDFLLNNLWIRNAHRSARLQAIKRLEIPH